MSEDKAASIVPLPDALHIRLICWEHKHVQVWSASQLRQIMIAPLCGAVMDGHVCMSPMWAVEHDGEPTRYVGRPPHANWEAWADCTGRVNTDSPVLP